MYYTSCCFLFVRLYIIVVCLISVLCTVCKWKKIMCLFFFFNVIMNRLLMRCDNVSMHDCTRWAFVFISVLMFFKLYLFILQLILIYYYCSVPKLKFAKYICWVCTDYEVRNYVYIRQSLILVMFLAVDVLNVLPKKVCTCVYQYKVKASIHLSEWVGEILTGSLNIFIF